jgi:tRNA dimethylallyltransferase
MIVVAGPTGSGKSDLALAIAERFRGEIVNCDSVQVYRYFEIGTAKVTPAGRRGIPHHLIDIVDPDQPFTAGDYSRLGRAALAAIAARGSLPVVVGGTGFYLKALLDGLFTGPERDEELRARLTVREQKRPGSLHRILRRLDPVASRRIHPNDTNKLIRALEVILTERRTLTEMFAAPGGRDPLTGYRTLKLALNPPRALLYARLAERTRRMFENGIVNEARAILARGFDEGSKPFESLGYAQALAIIKRAIDVPEAITETEKKTRQYAKRQWTWFRRDPEMIWLNGFGNDPAMQDAAFEQVTNLLTVK